MHFYGVQVHGEGVDVLTVEEDGTESGSIVGFWTIRVVRAKNSAEAAEKAQEMITRDWSQQYARWDRGEGLVLTVTDIFEVSFWAYPRYPNSGYTFYGPESDDDEEDQEVPC